MTQFRRDFINWRPDAEDFQNEGLVKAENVVHEPEGFKPVYLASSGTLSTTGGLASVTSIVCKPVGSGDDVMCAWLSGDTLQVGLNGVTMTTSTTGYPVSFSTATTFGDPQISFFDVCELDGKVVFTAKGQFVESSGTINTIQTTGFSTIVAT